MILECVGHVEGSWEPDYGDDLESGWSCTCGEAAFWDFWVSFFYHHLFSLIEYIILYYDVIFANIYVFFFYCLFKGNASLRLRSSGPRNRTCVFWSSYSSNVYMFLSIPFHSQPPFFLVSDLCWTQPNLSSFIGISGVLEGRANAGQPIDESSFMVKSFCVSSRR